MNAYNFAFARYLDGGSSGEFRRKCHRELDIRILSNFTIDVEEDAARTHIASLCMHRCVRARKPQPNRHFQRKSGEYALLFQVQDPVPEIFAFCNQSERHIEMTNSRRRSVVTNALTLWSASLLPDLVRYIAVSRPYATISQVLIPKEFFPEIKSFHRSRKCKSMHTRW